MIIASKDSLFLVNNTMFFKRFGYKVIHANDYVHALNNIKTLAETHEKINILIVKTRDFTEEDKYNLQRILKIDKNIMVVVLSEKTEKQEKNLFFLDYYSSPMEIIENIRA
mgnify:CR=1 FL=1